MCAGLSSITLRNMIVPHDESSWLYWPVTGGLIATGNTNKKQHVNMIQRSPHLALMSFKWSPTANNPLKLGIHLQFMIEHTRKMSHVINRSIYWFSYKHNKKVFQIRRRIQRCYQNDTEEIRGIENKNKDYTGSWAPMAPASFCWVIFLNPPTSEIKVLCKAWRSNTDTQAINRQTAEF